MLAVFGKTFVSIQVAEIVMCNPKGPAKHFFKIEKVMHITYSLCFSVFERYDYGKLEFKPNFEIFSKK